MPLALGASLHVLATGVPSGLMFEFWRVPARIEVDTLSAAFLGLGLLAKPHFAVFLAGVISSARILDRLVPQVERLHALYLNLAAERIKQWQDL